MTPSTKIAVVGATGAVGREMLEILAHRGVPAASLRCLASERSSGTSLPYGDEHVGVAAAGPGSFDGVDLALFSAGASRSRELAPAALDAGAVVIDNSSAFRMDPDVPLVVPEINGDLLKGPGRPALIANPNCAAIILVMAVDPLRRAFGVERLVVSTYQSASGAGAAALAELREQTRVVLDGGEPTPRVFREPCAFNVFSHDSEVDPATGRNGEEQKLMDESRKIWDDPALALSVTCVRVPVLRAHTESICVTLGEPAAEDEVRRCLAAAAGIEVVDDRAANRFPTARRATGRDAVLVGRVRPDPGQPADGTRHRGFNLLASGDQLRKGAALNAIQIAAAVGLLAPAAS